MGALPQNGSSLQSLKTKTQTGLPTGGGSHGDRQRFSIIAAALLDPAPLQPLTTALFCEMPGGFSHETPGNTLRGIRT